MKSLVCQMVIYGVGGVSSLRSPKAVEMQVLGVGNGFYNLISGKRESTDNERWVRIIKLAYDEVGLPITEIHTLTLRL